MGETVQIETSPAAEVVRRAQIVQGSNGICYATSGDISTPSADIERIISAVPRTIAAALDRKAFYFVPLAISEGDNTLIAERHSTELADKAVCHRNYSVGNSQYTFISTRLMEDKFSVAFEFFINVGHAFVDQAGVAPDFGDLVWKQAMAGVRGETSIDAYESRNQALGTDRESVRRTGHAADEKAKSEYLAAAFSDAIAVYLLSLAVDVNYYELRERDYPLLAPAPLAERLRKVAQLFPPNQGYEFTIQYRRRG